jgi:hypothetical protein
MSFANLETRFAETVREDLEIPVMKFKILTRVSVLAILLALAMTPLTTHGATKKKSRKAPSSEAILKSYSMDQIEGVSNYLLARVEADPLPKGTKVLSCDPSMTKVNAWLSGPIHALTDEKRATEVEAYKKSPATFAQNIRGCSDRCTCNAYQLLFEDVAEALKDDLAHAKNLAAMKTEMRKVGKDQSLKCAKALLWFCGSPFDQYLQRQ